MGGRKPQETSSSENRKNPKENRPTKSRPDGASRAQRRENKRRETSAECRGVEDVARGKGKGEEGYGGGEEFEK